MSTSISLIPCGGPSSMINGMSTEWDTSRESEYMHVQQVNGMMGYISSAPLDSTYIMYRR